MKEINEILNASYEGCMNGCLNCAEVNEIAAHFNKDERIQELEQAIRNIYKWTGSKKCARECERVVTDL